MMKRPIQLGVAVAGVLLAGAVLAWLLPGLVTPRLAEADAPAFNPGQIETDASDADAPTPPEDPTDAIAAAFAALEHDEPAAARRLLRWAESQLPEGSAPRLSAAVMRHQLDGTFAERLRPWLDRDVADVVVLVDDPISFIDAIDAWTDDTFFPVLMEDDWYAPLFVRAFEPRRVVRFRSSRAMRITSDDDQRRALAHAVAPHNQRITSQAGHRPPPGLVVLDPHDPHRWAAYALARGHGQPILAMERQYEHDATIDATDVQAMNDRIMQSMEATGVLRDDHWAAITLAGDYPYRYNEPGGEHNPLSVDDRLGRDETLRRRAFTGRLLGDKAQTIYQAMASLFLQPQRPLLLNGHRTGREPNPENPYGWWHLSAADDLLKSRGYHTTLIQNADATTQQFRERANPAPQFDMWWVNSAHGGSTLQMPGEQFFVEDTPLGRAMPMYVVASFGARNPWRERTIAGLALEGGAYWYFGSVHEPYLQAFVQNTQLAHRMQPGTPLGAAARQPTGHPFAGPWKLMLVGDPLFTLRDQPAERVSNSIDLDTRSLDANAIASEADLGERLRLSLLLKTDDAIGPLLDEATEASSFAGLNGKQRAQVARLLLQQGRADDLVRLPRDAVAASEVAAMLVRRALRDQLREHLEADDLDAVPQALIELAGLRLSAQHLRFLSRQWAERMEDAGRAAEVPDMLADIRAATDSRFAGDLLADLAESFAE